MCNYLTIWFRFVIEYELDLSLETWIRLKFVYLFILTLDPQNKIEIYNNIFSVLHSKYEIFEKRKILKSTTAQTAALKPASSMNKSMSFSALLAKSDSNENLLVEKLSPSNEMTESYVLIDNDAEKQSEVEPESDTVEKEPKVETTVDASFNKILLPAMDQVGHLKIK